MGDIIEIEARHMPHATAATSTRTLRGEGRTQKRNLGDAQLDVSEFAFACTTSHTVRSNMRVLEEAL